MTIQRRTFSKIAAAGARAVAGRDVIVAAAVSVLTMLMLVAVTRLSFLWAVPAGTLLCVGVAWGLALWGPRRAASSSDQRA